MDCGQNKLGDVRCNPLRLSRPPLERQEASTGGTRVACVVLRSKVFEARDTNHVIRLIGEFCAPPDGVVIKAVNAGVSEETLTYIASHCWHKHPFWYIAACLRASAGTLLTIPDFDVIQWVKRQMAPYRCVPRSSTAVSTVVVAKLAAHQARPKLASKIAERITAYATNLSSEALAAAFRMGAPIDSLQWLQFYENNHLVSFDWERSIDRGIEGDHTHVLEWALLYDERFSIEDEAILEFLQTYITTRYPFTLFETNTCE
ncbi:hypothetical protein JG687_00018013 [Phytophthora cactorum]|uniref:Uncharacterized protein n=1 Tax=Phytophthora cactorum TaxID=29920 RepID=A0A8T1TMS4_9STRA|nr:hypothetical protein PC120_g21338 [Phytophthora cactorum]KAG3085818.1 hypothetical protein PC121_g5079 [Phytophthora cactorum]KAG3151911.1 hypothetical protein PC128_g22902 [Phytophthora cactorum]KAG4042776.1 hypothetical protein PC123_g21744 [Phytophthora cactorum]KAG6944158.1 hypothetical protein JG687_00018013 [Phytophthora cactorum]